MVAVEKSLLPAPDSLLVAFDEVGRGAVAGPLCVGAVACTLEELELLAHARDSKSMSQKSRQRMAQSLQGIRHAFGCVDAAAVDQLGIVGALRSASAQALSQLPQADVFLVDGNLDWVSPKGTTDARVNLMVRADASCPSVSAASVLAKVHRDQFMTELADPGYGFASHKGYGTRAHYQAISRLGLSDQHRRSFKLPSWVELPVQ